MPGSERIHMKINYDPEADAIYVQLRQGDVDDTRQISKYVFVDEDENGIPLGLEILFASQILGQEEVPGITFSISQTALDSMAR